MDFELQYGLILLEDMNIGYRQVSEHPLQLQFSPHTHQDLVKPSISMKLRLPVGDSLVAGDSGTLLCSSFSTSFFSWIARESADAPGSTLASH